MNTQNTGACDIGFPRASRASRSYARQVAKLRRAIERPVYVVDAQVTREELRRLPGKPAVGRKQSATARRHDRT